MSGDNTLEAADGAVERARARLGDTGDAFVVVISDANLRRYGIGVNDIRARIAHALKQVCVFFVCFFFFVNFVLIKKILINCAVEARCTAIFVHREHVGGARVVTGAWRVRRRLQRRGSDARRSSPLARIKIEKTQVMIEFLKLPLFISTRLNLRLT